MDNENKAQEIVDRIRELVKKGNVARIMIKRGDEIFLNSPLNVGLVGTILGLTAAPWALIATAVATLGFDCKVELEKTDGQIVELLSRDVGQKAVDLGASVVEEIKDRFHKE